MKALVYHGPGERHWESVADPTITEPRTSSCASIPPRSAEPTCTS